MKKLVGYLTVLAVCLALTGCEKNESSSEKAETTTAETTQVTTTEATTTTTAATTTAKTTAKTTTTEKKTTKATTTATEAETTTTEEETQTQAAAGGSFSPSDVYAYYGGSSFTVNQDASTLPAAQSVDASPSCYYEGEDKIFHYGGIDVYTYPVGGADYVLEVTLLSSSASTAKGLTVGMTLNDAIAMYGEASGSGGMYTWSSGGVYMYVTESGGVITSIGLALNN